MRKFLLTACAVTGIGFASKAQNNSSSSVQDYIDQYKNIAMTEMVRTGVPASITLAQGILESGSGNSKLAKYSNNHFGIKCKTEWTGATVYQDDDLRGECFRVYQTAEESYKDHSDFLKNRPYYTALFDLDPTDYKGWAKGLKTSGYATERDYAKNLIGLIEKYNLEQYSDQGVAMMNGKSITTEQSDAMALNSNKQKSNNQQIALFDDSYSAPQSQSTNQTNPTSSNNIQVNNSNTKVSTENAFINISAYPSGIFRINQTSVMFAKKGTSLFAIAMQQKIDYGKLVSYNDLREGTDILPKDRLVFLSRKPKKGEKNSHIVRSGESLDEIAQLEGIQLFYLAQMNHIQTTAIPMAGENIYLRELAPNAPKLVSDNNMAFK